MIMKNLKEKQYRKKIVFLGMGILLALFLNLTFFIISIYYLEIKFLINSLFFYVLLIGFIFLIKKEKMNSNISNIKIFMKMNFLRIIFILFAYIIIFLFVKYY